MGVLKFDYIRISVDEKYGKGTSLNSISKNEFAKFNSGLLGIGEDISRDGEYINALVAVFDLEGFTSFCNQIDQHLVVPEFLSHYLNWLFDAIIAEFKEGEVGERITIWGSLPFYAKFLGDGILFIWNTDYSGGHPGIGNIVNRLKRICERYINEFLPFIERKVVKTPNKLRCGIARGQIISIGNGEDFVGPCINIASRLQKLGKLSFAVSRRGFDIEKSLSKTNQQLYSLKKVNIRGIGDNELVYILTKEFEALPDSEKSLFLPVGD